MKKIRVLHISETFAAGVYTYIKDICHFFDSIEEVENSVIYSGDRKDTDHEKIKTDFSANTILHQLSMTREISPVKDIKATIKLAKKIRAIKPDVIHLHSSKAGVIGRIASLFYPRAKVYYTPNGYSFLREDVSESKKKFFFNIEKYIQRLFGGTTIACGDSEHENALRIGPSILVRNGVTIKEVEQFKEPTIKTDGPLIGTMGRMSPQKNPALFNDIAKRFPNLKFVWIGDGEQRNLIDAENIDVKGWMSRTDAISLVNTFDVYIQTSLWEGLPFTIIEAMVLGKPIVANNVVGNKDAVQNEYNGYLCDSLDHFEKAINLLVCDKKKLDRFGTNSSTRAKKIFDKDKNFGRLFDIYTGKVTF
ncbi:glycosyltransferase [Muricauda sp. TY007]|uniref:glycosyltransferase n=1 Tax=Allomuricauda sp. TY007 TaxID=2683200 RepID=UPI0013C1BEF1|nr:glycosyltransferase [Muricauda sp. TY007]NDV14593.1 glycosyltransferase [Muricauda sp. TY007]